MLINSRNVEKEEIENNALPLVSSPTSSTNQGVLGIEDKEVVMEMMSHVMGQWFDRYLGATPTSSHMCRHESVRPDETSRTLETAPPDNPAPLVPVVAPIRWDIVEAIRKKGAKEFRGGK